VEILYVGSRNGPERRLAADAGLPFEALDVLGLQRRIGPRNVLAAVKMAVAVRRSAAILRGDPPDAAVVTGGYVGLPVALACRLTGVPLVVHEQNAVLGLANRIAARFARVVALSLPGTGEELGGRGHVVGNPVRPEIAGLRRDKARPSALSEFGLEPGRRTLLLTGGSQGARRINEASAGLYERWREDERVQVLQLTGARNAEAVEAALVRLARPDDRIVWRPVAYTARMDLAYAVADLAVSRAGASTIAELEAAAVPAVLVPYPFATGDHQRHNAEIVAGAGAAVLVPDAELDAERLTAAVSTLLFDDAALVRMSGAMRSLAVPDAAARLAALVRRVAGEPGDGGGHEAGGPGGRTEFSAFFSGQFGRHFGPAGGTW
jgi:UDP-N-acetylglucosamine--N-acetylmuramyl-(pentapeptide) pyrophosphoryl-undecaprenol N-acetylglucosamine transferase